MKLWQEGFVLLCISLSIFYPEIGGLLPDAVLSLTRWAASPFCPSVRETLESWYRTQISPSLRFKRVPKFPSHHSWRIVDYEVVGLFPVDLFCEAPDTKKGNLIGSCSTALFTSVAWRRKSNRERRPFLHRLPANVFLFWDTQTTFRRPSTEFGFLCVTGFSSYSPSSLCYSRNPPHHDFLGFPQGGSWKYMQRASESTCNDSSWYLQWLFEVPSVTHRGILSRSSRGRCSIL